MLKKLKQRWIAESSTFGKKLLALSSIMGAAVAAIASGETFGLITIDQIPQNIKYTIAALILYGVIQGKMTRKDEKSNINS